MSGKFYRYFYIIFICFLAMTGCAKKQDVALQSQDGEEPKSQLSETAESQDSTEEDLAFLTSDECNGRKPGTPGNEKAAAYIAERFEEIGLQPFLKDYRHSYTKETESLDEDTISLKILDGDRVLDTFEFGKDFIEIFLEDTALTLPFYLEPKDKECAVLVDDAAIAQEYWNNPYVKLLLVKGNDSRRGGFFYKEGITPQLRVYPETYDRLIEHVGKEIVLSCDIEADEKAQDNIVGIIRGEDHSNALVISAHYDHVGSAGDRIWRGALDNASGVCLLLETAKVIQDYYEGSQPAYDIIFCAFNSEENKMIGSKCFAELMQDKYQKFFNINLDCIGNKDYTSLFVYSNESDASHLLSNDLIDHLLSTGIVPIMKSQGIYNSDQESFENGIALTTINNTQSSTIHTLEDVPDNIDTDYLGTLAEALGNYITKEMNAEEFFAHIPLENKNKETEMRSYGRQSFSKEEFEETFDCKLDFANEALSNILIWDYRPVIKVNDSPDEMKVKTLQDIRHLVIELDYDKNWEGPEVRLDCITYKKDDPYEMEIMQAELAGGGYREGDLPDPITIEDAPYYISEGNENMISSFHENDEYFLWISARIIGLFKMEEEPTHEEVVERYQERLPVDYIEGVTELLLRHED
mgnify:FL=1